MNTPRMILLILGLVVRVGAQAPTQAPPPQGRDQSPRPGVGDLQVAPQRLIFQGDRRTEELFLVNIGPRTATYRINFVQMTMAEDGSLRELPEKVPGGKYADPILQFTPRQVTLEPGISQTVRVLVKKPSDLAAGEYRSHLVFKAVPEAEPVVADPEQQQPGISVRMTAIYGVAIPVIVRHGATTGTVAWESARILPGEQPHLEAVLARTGNQSVYGNLRVLFTPTGDATTVQVGAISMAAVYDGLPRRRFTVPLNFPGEGTARGRLQVRFHDPETDKILTETQLELH